ncbi:MAG TPA: hypothetical protein VHM20_02570 [Gammaproteobacteria bacterium]|jgi:hypothetical protein|nr:hypothetical protein [Gammaproteobacteria bacterium]
MFKKIVLTMGLYLAIICTSYANSIPINAISANDISTSEKDFNDQVMIIMKDIETKPINEINIDDYLNHVKASNHIKHAVKSSIFN